MHIDFFQLYLYTQMYISQSHVSALHLNIVLFGLVQYMEAGGDWFKSELAVETEWHGRPGTVFFLRVPNKANTIVCHLLDSCRVENCPQISPFNKVHLLVSCREEKRP